MNPLIKRTTMEQRLDKSLTLDWLKTSFRLHSLNRDFQQ